MDLMVLENEAVAKRKLALWGQEFIHRPTLGSGHAHPIVALHAHAQMRPQFGTLTRVHVIPEFGLFDRTSRGEVEVTKRMDRRHRSGYAHRNE